MKLGLYGAVIIGTLAGAVSTLGYQFVTDLLHEKLRIHDTCGVNNLHGMPGILGAVFSMIFGTVIGHPGFMEGLLYDSANAVSPRYRVLQ